MARAVANKRSCPYHGAGSCSLAMANWKICKSDEQFEGALCSWSAIAKYRVELDRLVGFIHQLFRYGDGPVIWIEHKSREKAPLYLVSHHGKGVQAHACYQRGFPSVVA